MEKQVLMHFARLSAAALCVVFLSACATALPASPQLAGGSADDARAEPASVANASARKSVLSDSPPQVAPTQDRVAQKAVADAAAAHAHDEAAKLSSLETASSPPQEIKTVDLPADIWERIRRGFAMPELHVYEVFLREQWYAQRSADVYRISERSSKYLFHIVEEIERRGLPTELALLPFVESAFNPQAYSRAKAAGMWQFIPSTGKHFDLKQNAFRDDRRDVLASTRAALDYLTKLHRMFGDWHLALAAYNWGEGSVGRAIARNQAKGLGMAYPDLSMPKETAQYVPKLLALKNVVQTPDLFGIKLPSIPNHPYFQSVSINRDIDLSVVARLAEVQMEDIKALNPSIQRPVILAAGVPQILLPWDNAEVFERNLAAHKGALASWTAWVTPVALKPADAAKAAGMAELDLRTINNITGKVVIKAGSTLLIPRKAQNLIDVTAQVADHGQVSLLGERVVRSKPPVRGLVRAPVGRVRTKAAGHRPPSSVKKAARKSAPKAAAKPAKASSEVAKANKPSARKLEQKPRPA
jgi:membrane-bound lytic murein transglycosylase D